MEYKDFKLANMSVTPASVYLTSAHVNRMNAITELVHEIAPKVHPEFEVTENSATLTAIFPLLTKNECHQIFSAIILWPAIRSVHYDRELSSIRVSFWVDEGGQHERR